MMRIVDQKSLFARIEAALERRIAESSLAATGLRLRLRTELGETELRLGGSGSVAADVSLPQATLMQLLMGYREAADALEEPDVRCDGEARRALGILFASPTPYVWQKDRF